jgi:hypothetical protein
MPLAHHKSAVSSMLISVEGKRTGQLETGRESMWDTSVLSLCHLISNPLPKPTGMLQHFREG